MALVAAIAAYFGIDLPQNELTATLTAGDSAGALSLIVGVLIGALGGYGAGAVRNQKSENANLGDRIEKVERRMSEWEGD